MEQLPQLVTCIQRKEHTVFFSSSFLAHVESSNSLTLIALYHAIDQSPDFQGIDCSFTRILFWSLTSLLQRRTSLEQIKAAIILWTFRASIVQQSPELATPCSPSRMTPSPQAPRL
jgi:hypothetical protein